MPLIHSWQMPSPQFLIDFVNFHHRNSITIYLPANVNSKPSLAEWQKDFSNRYAGLFTNYYLLPI